MPSRGGGECQWLRDWVSQVGNSGKPRPSNHSPLALCHTCATSPTRLLGNPLATTAPSVPTQAVLAAHPAPAGRPAASARTPRPSAPPSAFPPPAPTWLAARTTPPPPLRRPRCTSSTPTNPRSPLCHLSPSATRCLARRSLPSPGAWPPPVYYLVGASRAMGHLSGAPRISQPLRQSAATCLGPRHDRYVSRLARPRAAL